MLLYACQLNVDQFYEYLYRYDAETTEKSRLFQEKNSPFEENAKLSGMEGNRGIWRRT